MAREKNQKKQMELQKRKSAHEKGSNKGMSLEQRKQRYNMFKVDYEISFSRTSLYNSDIYILVYRDADLMREKQRRAAMEKQCS